MTRLAQELALSAALAAAAWSWLAGASPGRALVLAAAMLALAGTLAWIGAVVTAVAGPAPGEEEDDGAAG